MRRAHRTDERAAQVSGFLLALQSSPWLPPDDSADAEDAAQAAQAAQASEAEQPRSSQHEVRGDSAARPSWSPALRPSVQRCRRLGGTESVFPLCVSSSQKSVWGVWATASLSLRESSTVFEDAGLLKGRLCSAVSGRGPTGALLNTGSP